MTATTDLDERLSDAIGASMPGLPERLSHDPQAHLDVIRQVAAARDHVDRLLQSSVGAARSAGHSWEAIGSTLGMTRQAAQQRFGKGTPESGRTAAAQPETRRLTLLTSLNEMDILNRAGRYGWHSVGFGPLYHTVQRDTVQWEHLRVLAFDPGRAALTAQGWQQVGTLWFPWAYYARPTGEPALDGPGDGLEFAAR
ncbi:hypothetical protein [uncultured Deinococcus sp.]|uniref:hypothetical protein n=1 Tax=uncultured Deinococcus sp. TaxID=158789 RepID=UPI0025FAFEB2|nr:hypothetical protein [uncultured Deinococcus sp.]